MKKPKFDTTIDGVPAGEFVVAMMYETNVQKKTAMRERYQLYITEQAKFYDEMENGCFECGGECTCTDKPYVHKTAKQLVEEQEDRNSIGYWNDIRSANLR